MGYSDLELLQQRRRIYHTDLFQYSNQEKKSFLTIANGSVSGNGRVGERPLLSHGTVVVRTSWLAQTLRPTGADGSIPSGPESTIFKGNNFWVQSSKHQALDCGKRRPRTDKTVINTLETGGIHCT
jgi:hypothetical protein